MVIDEKQLRKFILDAGLISGVGFDAMAKKAKEKNRPVGELLISDGKISEDDLRRTEAYILGIPFVNLKGEKIDFEILSLIPEAIARNHNIVAYRKNGSELEVAMLDTDDLEAIDFVKKKVGLRILPRLSDTESIKSVLVQYRRSLKAEFDDIIESEAASIRSISESEGSGGGEATEGELKRLAEDLPVVRIVDTLLNHAIIQDASDLHMEPQTEQFLIRYRIDGILRDAMVLPRSAAPAITARIKVLANLKLDEKRLPQDGRFKITSPGQKISFRVSTLPTYFGEKTVMRLLKENEHGFTLEGLGFHGDSLERVHWATRQSTGMILATGPTGSGKTTTLYTILDILNTPEVNISTIEDPIEYQMQRINQTQVKPEIGLTFSNGLRSLVRQDPDIIMVGEIRDGETADLAVNAALTGHLVLSTLHTNSATGAMPRLIDMGVEPFLLVSTLDIVIAQRLVRRLCADKEKHILSPAELKTLAKSADMDKVLATLKEENVVKKTDTWETIPFYNAKKTAECEDGYSGRISIHEVLKVTPSIKELILKGVSSDELELQAKKEGMMTMIEDGIFTAARGITTIEEVMRVVSSE